MPNYTGCQCIVCQNTFKDEDDIVVCPDCGTPYHRSCYTSKGTCINTALHAEGKSWQDLHRGDLASRECPNCRHINAPDASHCSICHTSLHSTEQNGTVSPVNIMLPDGQLVPYNPNDPCCGMDPEEELDGERLGDVAEFVGTNTLYYLPLFKRFKETGRKVSVNLPALLFPHLYFASRRMWLMCFLTILAMNLCSLPTMLTSLAEACAAESTIEMYSAYGMDPTQMFSGLLAFIEANEKLLLSLDMVFYVVQLALRVLLCVFANWLYYRHVLKKVGRVRRSGVNGQMKQMLLRADGGMSLLNIFGAAGISLAVYFAIMCAILMPFMLV